MATIQALVLEVVLIILLTTIFDLLLPDGNLRPFVRLVMGLFVLATLLNPLLQFFRSESVWTAWDLGEPFNQAEWANIGVQGELWRQEELVKVEQEYQQSLAEQIKALASAVGLAEEIIVEIELSEDKRRLQQIKVSYEGAQNEQWEEELEQLVLAYYAIPQENLEIIWVGEN